MRTFAILGGVPHTQISPLVDVRLANGIRVTGALTPASFRGPAFTLRKDTREAFTFEDLVQADGLSEEMLVFFDYCLRYRKGIVLGLGAGITGSATLNAIGSRFSPDERVVTIESNVELLLPEHHNVVSFQEGNGCSMLDILELTQSMAPERTIIGAVSGSARVRAVLDAMDGVLEGAVFAYSASNLEAFLERVVYDALKNSGLDVTQASKLLASACPVVVQEQRFADGSRRLTRIAEICVEEGEAVLEDIFVFESDGLDENGLVAGSFRATGYVPQFLEELHNRGDDIDLGIFGA